MPIRTFTMSTLALGVSAPTIVPTFLEVTIDPAGAAHFKQRTELSGKDYVLSFDWNDREGCWYMSLADAAEVPIVAGRKVVADWPLLRNVTSDRRPRGELLAKDTSEKGLDPGFTDLGTRVVIYYADESTS